ncbi:MAG: STAS domain-containing protein [Clostridiaceae bacterium]|nr:STAS domain-containing protein [Clostridiaceae bacterium]
MTLSYTSAGGAVRASLTGELGHREAIEMMERLAELIDLRVPRRMVLDLSGLEFMDSSGIAVVVQTARRCANAGGRLSVEGVPPQAMRVFRTARVDRIVQMSPLEDEPR